jgi:hypothetical protein
MNTLIEGIPLLDFSNNTKCEVRNIAPLFPDNTKCALRYDSFLSSVSTYSYEYNLLLARQKTTNNPSYFSVKVTGPNNPAV